MIIYVVGSVRLSARMYSAEFESKHLPTSLCRTLLCPSSTHALPCYAVWLLVRSRADMLPSSRCRSLICCSSLAIALFSMDDAFEAMDAILDPGPLDLPFGPGVSSVEQVRVHCNLKLKHSLKPEVHSRLAQSQAVTYIQSLAALILCGHVQLTWFCFAGRQGVDGQATEVPCYGGELAVNCEENPCRAQDCMGILLRAANARNF